MCPFRAAINGLGYVNRSVYSVVNDEKACERFLGVTQEFGNIEAEGEERSLARQDDTPHARRLGEVSKGDTKLLHARFTERIHLTPPNRDFGDSLVGGDAQRVHALPFRWW